jgi:fumarate hydratase subunit alpha
MVRELHVREITSALAQLYVEINRRPREDVVRALREACEQEESEPGRAAIAQILANLDVARERGLPTCQDTGAATVFVTLGQEVTLTGGALRAAVDEGIREAHAAGHLRASMVAHPLDRRNTGDNTPAMLHVEVVPGSDVILDVLAKGAGSENMSQTRMLSPADGREGVVETVVETVREAGPNPCPPLVVGVGLGGTQEVAALLAKKALLRDLGVPSADALADELEREILERVNDLGIGPMGLGGRTTALGVLVEAEACHMASLPVAVNLMCHAYRHARVRL